MNDPLPPLKPKTCRQCKTEFIPARPLQMVCGYECSIKFAKKVSDKAGVLIRKAERRALREAKLKSKTRKEWLQDVQNWCNKYVRLRDGKICISCGTQKPDTQYCAGHYRTRGAAGHLRFDLNNVNVQCNKNCNLKLSGNILNYRAGLIRKIGLKRVEALENDNTTHVWTIDELQNLKLYFKAKIKEME